MIRWENLWKQEVVMVLLCGELMWGVDYNQWLPLQHKLCMNLNDDYVGNNEMFYDVNVKLAFVLTSIAWFNLNTL